MKNIKIIGKENCLLGEGPYYDAFSNNLRQVDIDGKEFITINLENGEASCRKLFEKPTAIGQFDDGSFFYAMESGIFDERGNKLASIEENVGARFNDGKVGPDGLFYVGTIEKSGNAVLYRLNKGKLERVVEGVKISNGLDWADDGKTIYYVDTLTYNIDAFDFPSFQNRRTVFTVDKEIYGGAPDGMCIDADGMLWVAIWGGAKVLRVDPSKSKVIDIIELPATYTSCPAFVGTNLDKLVVTSAKQDSDITKMPHSGSTFLVDVGVKGRKPYLCKKEQILPRKVAFVTGGGTGIGKVIAYELAKAGYDVAVHCNSSTAGAEEVCNKIKAEFGRKAFVIQSNLSSHEGVKGMFEKFDSAFDRIDLFVNNAGITEKSAFLETTEDLFDRIVNIDYKAAYFGMQEAAKRMAEKKIHGSIVLISSNNAIAHFADVSVYGSVKAAIRKAAEHMAVELAKYKIRVNTIAPGWTDTGAARLDDKESTFYKVPLCRWATPAEIAHAVLYLSDDYADSISGTTIVIDGGALMVSDKASRYGYHE